MPETQTTSVVTAPDAPAARPVIPGHELLRRIGQGSYGEVWLARESSGAFRAVKVVYRKTFEHDRPFQREFSGIQKFEPISRTHSSQVGVLCVGRDPQDGYFYYSMELADDEITGQQINPLAYVPKTIRSEIKKRGRLPFRECLEIGLALTTALEHLHKHGLIHRDIKPSNIIFVNGVPKLADIGLVTDVGATISYVGTEGYLPPEGPVSPLADIFSLGKVLYELATGRDRLDFPELPTLLGNAGEKDRLLELNLVFLRACQNEVRRRYQSAHEMHADLALLQSGRSLRRARALERRLRNITRGAAAAGVIGLIVAGSYFWMERQELAASRRKAEIAGQAEDLARKDKDKMLARLVASYIANGSNVLSQDDLAGAVLWFAEAAKEDFGTNQALHQARISPLLARCPKVLSVLPHEGPVNAVVLSPDNRTVATGSDDRTVQLWDPARGDPAGTPLKHASAVQCLAVSPDGRRLAAGCADGTVQVWNPATGEPVAGPLAHGGPVRRVMFHKGGQWLLSVSEEAGAKVWNASSGQLRLSYARDGRVSDAAFSPDGQFAVTAGSDGIARLWKFDRGDGAPLLLAHDAPVTQVAFSPDSRRVITVSSNTARIWNVATGDPADWRMDHGEAVTCAAFSPDGLSVATGGQDRAVHVWNARTGQPRLPPIELESVPRSVSFSPDGRHLLVTEDKSAQVWNASTGQAATPPLAHGEPLRGAHFSTDGDRAVTASADGTARVIELWSGVSLVSALRHEITAAEAARSPDLLRSPPAMDEHDLLQLVEVVSGRTVDSAGQMVPLSGAALRQSLQAIQKKWPGVLRPAEQRAWHLREAEASDREQQWFAAVFHLDRVMAEGAADPALRQRRELAAARLNRSGTTPVQQPEVKQRIPPRPPTAKPELIDLGGFYNAGLLETWLPSSTVKSGNDLSELPPSVQEFSGVQFDARGVIQLSSSAVENLGALLPREVAGIPINRKCQRLRFLHGAAWDAPFGTPIGGYRVHYVNGVTQDVRLVFGVNVREWWSSPQQSPITSEAAVAWPGANPASRAVGMAVRLYQMAWFNRSRDVEIRSIDFYSTMARPAPFLLAVTAE
jgi:WD40 repeat protein